jgi:hypothetical protein
MEKHKAPTQLPTNEPSLELQIFKKSIGGTLGGAIEPVVVFPLYSGGGCQEGLSEATADNPQPLFYTDPGPPKGSLSVFSRKTSWLPPGRTQV